MTFSEFIQKYDGKQVEVAGSSGALYQCVDLANAYIRDVLLLPIIEWTNAKDFPSKANGLYDFPSTPQNGDLVVWNGNVGLGAGHIGVFIEGTTSGFKSFDQNWRWNQTCHIENHTYQNVSTYMRKKGVSMHDPVRNTYFQWISHLIGDGRPYEQNDQEYEKRLLEIVNKILTNRG